MKIALVGRYGEGNILTGPERVARELYSELTKTSVQAVFIDYFFSGYEGSSLFKKAFGKENIKNGLVLRLGIFPFLFMLFQKKFEIIHIVNSQRFILLLLFFTPFFSGKIITTLHGFIRNEIPAKKFWKKRYFIDLWVEKLSVKKSRLLIFPSSLLLNTFKQFYKISDDSFIVIPNGISKIFVEQERKFPAIDNSLKIIFYKGFNDSINRGLDKLLNSMNNLKFEVELYVIGNKVEVKPPKNIKIFFVDSMPHIELINFVSDKHFNIKSCAYDTFPIIVAECMTLGLIPIISENIGIKDVIKNGVNGFVYNSSSSNELSELMNEIYCGNYDLNAVSNNAKKVYELLNWNKVTQQYLAAYKTVL
jgi:glycosyltransferase involved in cell wall biosynthesis